MHSTEEKGLFVNQIKRQEHPYYSDVFTVNPLRVSGSWQKLAEDVALVKISILPELVHEAFMGSLRGRSVGRR